MRKTPEQLDKIRQALKYFGEADKDPENCDVCEDGSVYLGLTQILPAGSLSGAAEIQSMSKEEEPKTWKEWWRYISCHSCGECEGMPGDEQRWHSQTFEFIVTLNGEGVPEELHDHAVYKCPSCGGYVVDELVEETMNENGVVED